MIATSNRTSISYIKELTPGVTPTDPALRLQRYTGESLNAGIVTTASEEIRSDRQTSDLPLVDISNGGDVNGEFSAVTYDDWFESVLFSDTGFSTPIAINDVDISAANATNALTSAGAVDFTLEPIVIGQWIKIDGFTDPNNNGYFRVSSIAPTILMLDANIKQLNDEPAGNAIIITGSQITNGVTDSSYTIQKTFEDATVPTYVNFTGMRVGTMSVELTTGSIATLGFSFLGTQSEITETQYTNATLIPATTTEVMNAVSNVAVIQATASTDLLSFNDLTVTVENNLRELKAIGTLGSVSVRAGVLSLTGSITPYFESMSVYETFLNNTSFEIYFRMEDSVGNAYIFNMRNCKFSDATLEAGSLDQDIILDASFQAILDGTSQTTITIDKFDP